MDWIKKRYDQFILTVAALALLAFGIMIVLKTGTFGEKFASTLATIPPNNTLPPLEFERVEKAQKELAAPPVWKTVGDKSAPRGSMFVSEVYVIGKETSVPQKPENDKVRQDS